jgi:hypothetical protein
MLHANAVQNMKETSCYDLSRNMSMKSESARVAAASLRVARATSYRVQHIEPIVLEAGLETFVTGRSVDAY